MLIAEFARVTGLTRDAIRFYVKRGLLNPSVGITGTNRYQRFDAADIERVALIQVAQVLGFTIKQIVAISSEFDEGRMDTARKIELMQQRLGALDEQAARLRAMRRYLTSKISWMENGEIGDPPLLRLPPEVQRPGAVTHRDVCSPAAGKTRKAG